MKRIKIIAIILAIIIAAVIFIPFPSSISFANYGFRLSECREYEYDIFMEVRATHWRSLFGFTATNGTIEIAERGHIISYEFSSRLTWHEDTNSYIAGLVRFSRGRNRFIYASLIADSALNTFYIVSADDMDNRRYYLASSDSSKCSGEILEFVRSFVRD